MKKYTVIVLAVLGVMLVATGGVVAHGSGDSDDTGASGNDTAAERGEWMERHMTEHMGADAAERMQEWMGMSYEEMGEHMAAEGSSMGGMGCH